MKALLKGITSIALCWVVSNGQAQLIIRPAVPRLGIIQKSQLWNLLVINTLPGEAEISISLVLQDRQTGYTLMTAQSGNIKLAKGSKQLNEQAVFPVQYRYETIFNNNNQQALLPVGNYLACYSVISTAKQESVAQECVAIDVAPLSPPQLMYPANGSQIVERSPQLSWIPPTPAILFSQLRYDVAVTEVYPGQSPAEAIQRNTPFYVAGSIPQQSIPYPASATSLDTGKVYAWQIIAKNGESYAAKSDVWTFTIRPQTKVEKILAITPFVRMKKEDAELTIAPDGILKFVYFHQAPTSDVSVTIEDISKVNANTLKPFVLKVVAGENYIQESLRKHLKLEAGHVYLATLINSAHEKFILRFEVKDFNK